MYARSTTMRGNPQAVDDVVAMVRDEVMPMVTQLDGCVGLSLLIERDAGRAIATSSWETEEAMHASAEQVRSSRERAAERFGAAMEIQEWEIAVLHRMHPAPEDACCRVIWSRGNTADLERVVDTFRMAMLPRIEELPGFCSVSMLVNRETGVATTATVYESRDSMNRATEMAKPMREEFTRQMGGEITEVAEFDLVLAHLRVPETV
jgi:heme-degrading monooxygenase HmoA